MFKLNKDNRELSKNEKILLGTIGIMSILAICYILIIQPNFKKTEPLVKENQKLTKEIEAVKNIQNEIANRNKELESLNAEYKKAAESLPELDKYPLVANDLNEMAKKHKLNIKSSKFEEAKIFEEKEANQDAEKKNTEDQKENEMVKNLNGLKYLDVFLELQGNEGDVIGFVNELENTDRILVVDTLNLDEKDSSIRIIYYISEQGKNEKEEYDFN